jgi:hypothetical protein
MTRSWWWFVVVVVCCWILVSSGSVWTHGAALPRAAPADTPWEKLRATLSDPDLLQTLTPQIYNDNCFQKFVVTNNNPLAPAVDGSSAVVSNYQLKDHPACSDHAFCVYQNCSDDNTFYPLFPPDTSPYVLFTNHTIQTNRLSIPAMTLEPQGVADIVAAVQFCAQHQVGVSVKVRTYYRKKDSYGTCEPRFGVFSTGWSSVVVDDDLFYGGASN